MRITRADPGFLPDTGAWSRLAEAASEPNPFFEHWFLKPALSHLAQDREIWIAQFWMGTNLCGLMPLSIREYYGRSPARHVGNWGHYQCFMGTALVRKGSETAFWQRLILALDTADWAPGFLSITGLDLSGPVYRGLIEAADGLSRPSPVVHHQERAMLKSSLNADAYLETHVRPKKRKEWRRLDNRLADLGTVTFYTFKNGDDLTGWCEDFLALEAAGWKGKEGAALGNNDATQAFFVATLKGAFAAGKLDFQKLSLDGRPIAMLINFMTPPGSWSFKIAYDEGLARFSPGVMIELRNLECTLSNSAIDWMDSCAVENHPMIDSLWAERRQIVQVSVPLSGVRRRATYHLCRAAETASATVKSVMKSNRNA